MDIIPYTSSLPFTMPEMRDVLASQLAPSSIAMYQRDVLAYRDYAERENLDALSPQTLMRWRDALVTETRMSPNTINRMLSAVKRLMKEAATREKIPEALEAKFRRVEGVKEKALKNRLKVHARTRIEPEDMRRLCNSPDTSTVMGVRDRALLAVLASSAVRAEELASLTWQQVQKQKDGYILLVRGKTDTDYRQAPLSVEAYRLLMEWKEKRPFATPYVFTSFSGNRQIPLEKQLSNNAVWKIVTHYAEKCELAHIKPHDFRRFVGTQLAAKDLRDAQVALGHKDVSTTAKHYVLDNLKVGLTDHLY